jgi:pyruvate ferredoxin oxidoreductase delta subunit
LGKKVAMSEPCEGSSGLTGTWRIKRPVIDQGKCTHCLQCWLFCPESAVIREDGKVRINYDYCKGCGICGEVCASKAITVVMEE